MQTATNHARLTPGQYELMQQISGKPGNWIKRHISTTGAKCYRLMDAEQNPICNISENKVLELCAMGYLETESGKIVYSGKKLLS